VVYYLQFKTKTGKDLFGQLHFLQQFPRVYLALFKAFTAAFNYSYVSLRLPSFLVSLATIMLSYDVTRKLFDKLSFTRYLFMMILASSFTFVKYFVEVKQYPMDILLSVLAVWQSDRTFDTKDKTISGLKIRAVV
jgi:4-amino-4-deoxy-L-arabinose transferase-like glycosyltransferase